MDPRGKSPDAANCPICMEPVDHDAKTASSGDDTTPDDDT